MHHYRLSFMVVRQWGACGFTMNPHSVHSKYSFTVHSFNAAVSTTFMFMESLLDISWQMLYSDNVKYTFHKEELF